MIDATLIYVVWALVLGAVSAVSLPLGSLVGLNVRFQPRYIAILAAFGAGALIAALSLELVAPTAFALTEQNHAAGSEHAYVHFSAMLGGGVLGGLVFVALDAVVNTKGGYLRKTSTTLAYLAKRRREKVQKVMEAVLEVHPFDALPGDMGQMLASMLIPVDFRQSELISGPDDEPATAYIVLEGEVDIDISGKLGGSFGPGNLIGVAMLFAPKLTSVGTIRAKNDLRCLALAREDVEQLRSLSSDFDKACRDLAAERLGELEQHLATRLNEAVEWTRAAASALRLGEELPALALRRAHEEHKGSPLAVWLGILLDGIPESVVIGAGLFTLIAVHPTPEDLRFAQAIPYTLVAGLFLSNFPEALSSSANMLGVGWSRRRIFLMWFALMVITAVGAGLGFLLAGVLAETWLVFAEGLAAGAMLTMIAAAMIPEAAAHGNPSEVGLATLAGFLGAVMFKLLE
ncbi:MAG: cyclic nucleotide-binding domain-containing protein [Pseudomonadales bacterium]